MNISEIQEQLNDIQGARDDIQSTLESKGVSVSNDIRTYAAAVDNLGNINTVNGIGADENRNAQIDASNINVDDTAEITQTIKSAIEEMNTEIAERLTKTEAEPFIDNVSFDNTTFTFTFKNYKGETQTFDLPLESTVKSGRYDDTTKALILVLQSDDEVSIPVNELCDVYTGIDGAKVKVTVNSNNEIEATIKEGTITKTDLTQELQEEITNKVDNETFNNLDTQVKELETEVEGKATTEQLNNSINTLSTEVENKASIDYVDGHAKVWFIDTDLLGGGLTPEENPEEIAFFQKFTDYLFSVEGGIDGCPVTPVIKYGWDGVHDYATINYSNWSLTRAGSYDIVKTMPKTMVKAGREEIEGTLYNGVHTGITVNFDKNRTVTSVEAEKDIEIELGYFKIYNDTTQILTFAKSSFGNESNIHSSVVLNYFKNLQRDVYLVLTEGIGGNTDISSIFYFPASLELIDNCYSVESLGSINSVDDTDNSIINSTREVLKLHIGEDGYVSKNELIKKVDKLTSKQYVDMKTDDIEVPTLSGGSLPIVTILNGGTGYNVGEIVSYKITDIVTETKRTYYLTIVGVDSNGAVTDVIQTTLKSASLSHDSEASEVSPTYVTNYSGSGSGLSIQALVDIQSLTEWGSGGFKRLTGFEIINKGTGYAVGDLLFNTGTGMGTVGKVETIGENGEVESISIYTSLAARVYPIAAHVRVGVVDMQTNGSGNGVQVRYQYDTTGIASVIEGIYEKIPSDPISQEEFQVVMDELDAKQNTLVSGTNIKTVNGETLLGSGDLVIEDNTIFHWDGNGSDTDPNSIVFWQKVVDASMLRDVYITVIDTVDVKGPRLLCIKQGDITDGTKVYSPRGILYDIYSDVNEDEGCYIGLNFATAYLRLSQKVVTYVEQGVGAGSINTYKEATFLPTKGTNVTGYVPTYDYHPATKKYVDDAIVSYIDSLNASEVSY